MELMIRPLTMIFLLGRTQHLTKSLVHFRIQNFVLLKFDERVFGVPKALQLARAEKLTGVEITKMSVLKNTNLKSQASKKPEANTEEIRCIWVQTDGESVFKGLNLNTYRSGLGCVRLC